VNLELAGIPAGSPRWDGAIDRAMARAAEIAGTPQLRATRDAGDFRAYYGQEPPEYWLGVIAECEGSPLAFGLVEWDERGRAWGSVDGMTGVSAFAVFRAARQMIAMLANLREPALYAFCFPEELRPGGAQRWLERLGFREHPTLVAEYPIWVRRCAG
jgi:hypothetical protein